MQFTPSPPKALQRERPTDVPEKRPEGSFYQSQFQASAFPGVLGKALSSEESKASPGAVIVPLTEAWRYYFLTVASDTEEQRHKVATQLAFKLVGEQISASGSNDYRPLGAISQLATSDAIATYLASNSFVPGASSLPSPQLQVGQVGWTYGLSDASSLSSRDRPLEKTYAFQ